MSLYFLVHVALPIIAAVGHRNLNERTKSAQRPHGSSNTNMRRMKAVMMSIIVALMMVTLVVGGMDISQPIDQPTPKQFAQAIKLQQQQQQQQRTVKILREDADGEVTVIDETMPSSIPSRVEPSADRLLRPEDFVNSDPFLERATDLPFELGANNYTITRPEGVREWHLYVPWRYTPQKAWSLVVALHGLGDSATNFAARTNLTNLADDQQFILIYPLGSLGLLGTGWNAGTCCVGENIDDLGFIMTIVDLVMQNIPIRNESVHSLGFSNGSFMTESLGCHYSETFRSVGSVSGNTILQWGAQQALAACDAVFKQPTSILHVHGTSDFVVPFDGNALLGWGDIPSDIKAWANRNLCGSQQPIQTLNVSTFTNQLWQNCGPNGDIDVELVINAGGGHQWPMVRNVFQVSNYVLNFWNRVTPNGMAPVPI